MHHYSQKLTLRKDYINKSGKAALIILVTINRKLIKVPLNLYWEPRFYDFEKNELIPRGKKDQDMIDAYIVINKVRSDINDIFIKYRTTALSLSIEIFKRELAGSNSRKDFIEYMEKKVMYRYRGGLISEPTFLKHKGTVEKLKLFRDKIHFNDLSPQLFEDFNVFLRRKSKNSENSRWSRFKNIATYLNMARDEGIMFVNPFKNMHDRPKQVRGKMEFLTKEELGLLKQEYFKEELPPQLHRDLRNYLFSCYTGVRISDIGKLTEENIIGDELVFFPHKTIRFNKQIRIPLTKFAKSLISMDSYKLFEKISDQKTNSNLKVISEKVGITKKLSFHTARHTFATLFLQAGGKVEVLKELLGHSDLKTTMVYTHITADERRKQINLLENF